MISPSLAGSGFDGITIVLRLGGAVNVEIVDRSGARDHIDRGELRRDTPVTIYSDGAPVTRPAAEVPCLTRLFDDVLGAGAATESNKSAILIEPTEQPAGVAERDEEIAKTITPSDLNPIKDDATTLREERKRLTDAIAARARTETNVRGKRKVSPVLVTAKSATTYETPRKSRKGFLVGVILVLAVLGWTRLDRHSPLTDTTTTSTTEPATVVDTSPSAESTTALVSVPTPLAPEVTSAPPPSAASSPTDNFQPMTPSPTFTTSFDCSRATAGDEELICHDERLAAYDVAIHRAYAAIMARLGSEDRLVLRNSQRGWLRQRRDCTHSSDARACIAAAYDQQYLVLQRAAQMNSADPIPSHSFQSRRRNDDSTPLVAPVGSVVCALPNGDQVAIPLEQCRQRNGVTI